MSKEPNVRDLGRYVRKLREAAQEIDLSTFPPAAALSESELTAIQSTVTQTLETVECIMGMRGADAQNYLMAKEPSDAASEVLAGLVLMHRGLTAKREG